MSKKDFQSINAPVLVTVLDISTGHITKKDDRLIKEAANEENVLTPIITYDYAEGYFVYVPSDDLKVHLDRCKRHGMSAQFCKILRLAAARGIKYVQFDCDGTPYNDLKTYNW
jgi:hypothetical protein